jgi:hypothetical protein
VAASQRIRGAPQNGSYIRINLGAHTIIVQRWNWKIVIVI